jgi:hypothetical protein
MPDRIGTWGFEAGNALVGQLAQLSDQEIDLPGHPCGRPSFQVLESSRMWREFEECHQSAPAGVDCRSVGWVGDVMKKCAGSEGVLKSAPAVYAGCSRESGGYGVSVAQVSSTRVLVGLWDGRGFLCMEKVPEETEGAAEQGDEPAEAQS